ncbi:recombination protein RecR [Patescibacteria group bacterium]|nr:recombination protein RecR [Patescibacteria group bacterium]MBU1703079.1 recombination protein RecR [Patescibacteria group bacterium]MBU1953679.1 recombination protein RecR [Patescibacteria group bacterium]
MSSFLPQSIRTLIEEFSKLPGVGPKSAQRLAMHLLHSPESRVNALSDAVGGLKKGLQFCGMCWNIAEDSICRICANPARDKRQICVVEEILDVVALEKTCEYKGVYHVLHGALSPVDGIGPEQLKVQALVDRVRELTNSKFQMSNVECQMLNVEDQGGVGAIEVILATNPGLEGETTALYLMRLLQPFKVNTTRIARGLPVGGDLDYADELTLTRALQGRAAYC